MKKHFSYINRKLKSITGVVLSLMMILPLFCIPQFTERVSAATSYSFFTSDKTSSNWSQGLTVYGNVTWDNTLKAAKFSGAAGDSSSARAYVKINGNPLKELGANKDTGFTVSFDARINSTSPMWGRLFDFGVNSDKYVFLNGGQKGAKYGGIYGILESCYGYPYNSKPSEVNTWPKKQFQSTVAGMTYTTFENSLYDTTFDHYDFVVAPGGYTTLYVNDIPVSWLSSNSNVENVLSEINNFTQYFIGRSAINANDGSFNGYIKNFTLTPDAPLGTYDGVRRLVVLHYESNGGTAIASSTVSNLPNPLPKVTKTGYDFYGWFTDSKFQNKAVPGVALTRETTLYAKFHKHEWTFTSSGASIIATCANTDGNCEVKDCRTSVTLEKVITSQGKTVVQVVDDNQFAVNTKTAVSDISYYKTYESEEENWPTTKIDGATEYGKAPSKPGSYVAKITSMDGSTLKGTALLEYTIDKPETGEGNYSSEPLNNMVTDEGENYKHVFGDSLAGGNNTQSVKLHLQKSTDRVIAYKIADIEWDGEDYEDAEWEPSVFEWVQNNDKYKSESTYGAFHTPGDLGFAAQTTWDEFYNDLAGQKATLLDSLSSDRKIEPDPTTGYTHVTSDKEGETIESYFATLDNLTFGQWLVVVTTGAGGFQPTVINVIPQKTATGYYIEYEQEVDVKFGQTAIVKKINGRDYDTVAIGDTVQFDIRCDMPSFADSEIVVNDIMSKAFSITNTSDMKLKFIISEEDGVATYGELVQDEDYIVSQNTQSSDGATIYTFVFDGPKCASKVAASIDNKLYLTYSAKVTINAEYNSDNNYNTVQLIVNNEKPLEDTVRAYTYALNVIKLDGSSATETEDMNPLENATFALYREAYIYVNDEWKANYDDILAQKYSSEVAEGYDNGVHESVAPAQSLEDFEADTTNYFIYEEKMDASGTISDTEITYAQGDVVKRVFVIVKQGDGKDDFDGTFKSINSREGIYINGLKDGNYILSEIESPFGYNLLAEAILFSINRLSKNEAELSFKGTMKCFRDMNNELNETGYVSLTVLNYRGLTLPSTGGMGVVLFTIIGILVMAFAIIMIIAKSKKTIY